MKFAVSTLAFVVAATFGASAFAAEPAATTAKEPAKQLTPQQQKMKDCNAKAGDKKGDERKAFMSTCLKAGSTDAAPAAAAAAPSQQQKMKTCNADANTKGLKGDDRKAYMKDCLKSDGSGVTGGKH